MIVGVLADTHGNTELISRQLRRWKPDCLIFAGDFYIDGQKIARNLKTKFYGVRGNCDNRAGNGKDEDILELAEKKIYLTHGHQYGVKEATNRLYYRASEVGADAVVYGHTHAPHLEQCGDIWMINPGSPTRPRFGTQGTYAIIEMETGVFKPRIIYL